MTVLPTPANSDFEFEALSHARNYRAALIREFSPELRGRVLEIGAGIGQFSADLAGLPAITTLCSVEPDPRHCARFREARPALRLVHGYTTDVPTSPAWDAIVCVNVLEHIEDDARELRAMHDRLAPGTGHLCLFVPARPEIYAPLDRDFGHFRRYRRQELRDRLTAAGFSIVRLHYFNSLGYFAWWWRFKVRGARGFDAARVKLFDRVVFPAVSAAERRIGRPPFGQSLLAVARADGLVTPRSS